MTVTVRHASLTGAAANPHVLVDGPKWDAEHEVVGLENVDNTSDADKPVSTAQALAITMAGVLYSTKSVLEDTVIPFPVLVVQIAGYYEAGDTGRAFYRRADDGQIQSLDGAWWKIAEPFPSVDMFGAKGTNLDADAAVNDAAIAAAVAHCISEGLTRLNFVKRYAISAQISISYPLLLAGHGRPNTIIRQTNLTANGVVFDLAPGEFGGGLCDMVVESGAGFQSTFFNGAGSAGVGIVSSNARVNLTLENFAVYNFSYGVVEKSDVASGGSYGVIIHNFDLRYFTGDAIQIDTTGDVGGDRDISHGNISNGGFAGDATSSCGIRWSQSGGDYASTIDITGCAFGVAVVPQAGKVVGALDLNNIRCDTCINDAFLFDGSLGLIDTPQLTDCWGAFGGQAGLHVKGANVKGLNWTSGRLRENDGPGAWLEGGVDTTINGAMVASNSKVTPFANPGVKVSGGVSKFKIQNCRIGNFASSLTGQAESIKIEAGISTEFVIEGNDLSNPGAGHAELVNLSVSANYIIKDNLPIYVNESAVETAAALTANVNDMSIGNAEILRLSSDATRHITGMSGGVTGRRISLQNVGANPIVLDHQSVASLLANRFLIGADITLAANAQQSFFFDSASTSWRPYSTALPNVFAPGSYGSANQIPVITLDVQGRTTNVTNTPIAGLTTAAFAANVVDTDGTLAANSDTRVASQKAVKTYADALIAANDAMVFKGVVDCSANPNYPAADRGWTYKVSVAGKIGGASGPNVEVGDMLLCITDGTASGTQAAVGAQWNIVQVNVDGALVGPASAVDGTPSVFDGATGKLVKNITYAAFKTLLALAKGDVGLGNVVNLDTSTQTNVAFTGLGAAAAAADADTFPVNQGAGNLKQTLAAIKTWIKAWIVKGDVGLGNVDNTSDATKDAAVATLTNKTLVAPALGAATATSLVATAQVSAKNYVASSSMTNAASAATPHVDVSSQTGLAVADGAAGVTNSTIGLPSGLNGIWFIQETAQTGDTGIYAVFGATLVLISSASGFFVTPTTTPAAGKFCPQYDGVSVYKMYSRFTGATSFKAMFMRVG